MGEEAFSTHTQMAMKSRPVRGARTCPHSQHKAPNKGIWGENTHMDGDMIVTTWRAVLENTYRQIYLNHPTQHKKGPELKISLHQTQAEVSATL